MAVMLVWLWGWPALRGWQFDRTVSRAQALLDAGELQGANIAARQALTLQPGALDPLRILASIARRVGSPDALLLQQQICETPGAPATEWFTLVRIAVGFGESAIAEDALFRVPDPIRQTAAWHDLAGLVAVREKRLALAEQHYREALRLAPGQPACELNLAAVQLTSPDPALAATARATLEKLASDPVHGRAALRNLLDDARRQRQPDRAKQWAAALAKAPGATIQDRLETIEELRTTNDAAFRTALDELKEKTDNQPAAIATLMRWLNDKGRSEDTLVWFESLPQALRGANAIVISAAEACEKTGRWDMLATLTAESDWGAMDFLRHAFRARAIARGTAAQRTAPFRSEWDQAVQDTRGNYSALNILARLVEGWQWSEQAAEVWWLIAERPAGQRRALKALFAIYQSLGDTAKLYAVAQRIQAAEPENPIAKNNVAMFALLLDRDLPAAHTFAAELHAAFPANAALASTFAFSLLKQQKPADALRVMEGVPVVAGEDSSITFYRALVRTAAGHPDEARTAIESALAGSKLLPEEKTFARSLLPAP